MVYPYWDSDIGLIGTVVKNSVGAWDENGGIYRVQLDTGRAINCSEESRIPYVEEKEN